MGRPRNENNRFGGQTPKTINKEENRIIQKIDALNIIEKDIKKWFNLVSSPRFVTDQKKHEKARKLIYGMYMKVESIMTINAHADEDLSAFIKALRAFASDFKHVFNSAPLTIDMGEDTIGTIFNSIAGKNNRGIAGHKRKNNRSPTGQVAKAK